MSGSKLPMQVRCSVGALTDPGMARHWLRLAQLSQKAPNPKPLSEAQVCLRPDVTNYSVTEAPISGKQPSTVEGCSGFGAFRGFKMVLV